MLLGKVTQASSKAITAQQARDEIIRQAAREHTVRAIAAAAGLSPSRIHQIIHGR